MFTEGVCGGGGSEGGKNREREGEKERKKERGWLKHGIADMKGIQVSTDDGTTGELLEIGVCMCFRE